jgi:hypothetical protein
MAGGGAGPVAGGPIGGDTSGSAGGDGGVMSGPGGGAGAASGGTSGGGGTGAAFAGLTIDPAQGLWTGVRYYAGATPSGRTSGPKAPPEQVFQLHNASSAALSLTVKLTGADAARFKLLAPLTPQLELAAGASAEVKLSIVTDNATLSAAPAQNDGATVFNAALEVVGADPKLSVRNYA